MWYSYLISKDLITDMDFYLKEQIQDPMYFDLLIEWSRLEWDKLSLPPISN